MHTLNGKQFLKIKPQKKSLNDRKAGEDGNFLDVFLFLLYIKYHMLSNIICFQQDIYHKSDDWNKDCTSKLSPFKKRNFYNL